MLSTAPLITCCRALRVNPTYVARLVLDCLAAGVVREALVVVADRGADDIARTIAAITRTKARRSHTVRIVDDSAQRQPRVEFLPDVVVDLRFDRVQQLKCETVGGLQ